MTDTAPVDDPTTIAADDVAAGWFGDEDLAALAAFGRERAVAAGEVLYRPGDADIDLFVVLEGRAEIVRVDTDDDVVDEVVIVTHGPGRILGELNLLTGQRPYLLARMADAGRVLAIPPSELRRLMGAKPEIADRIFRALMARRELLRGNDGALAVRIIGSHFSPEAMALRAFAHRTHLVHTWIDLEEVDDGPALLTRLGLRPDDLPAVITPTATLPRPTPGEFAEHLGLTFHPVPGYVFDLVVVGTGPAGLAAAVYGASEGLDTVSLDSVAIGGQAGASSRIENYVGFPNGITGEELATRAAIQAQRLGARLNSPCEVAGLHLERGFHVLRLADGSELPTKAVIVASGARYRRLPVEHLERFEGAGVYYAATEMEARVCRDAAAVVVGGGNSAGQAALFLAQQGSEVSIVIRGDDLAASMSHYLIERIEADPRIELHECTEVRSLNGNNHLESIVLEHTVAGEQRTVACAGLFCFIGAQPATEWLCDVVLLDEKGFVLTDRSLPSSVVDGPLYATRRPLPFETSVPGVFAVGDVRHGSLKRVAAAVGEGSSAVRSVHEHLATFG
jgi:thioredoxin reductase (NADPH)